MGKSPTSFRKARTRTLIQLGGLVEKAGLLETMGLIPGADLQKDPLMKPIALSFLGALLEAKQTLQTKESSLDIWRLKAQVYLNENALKQ